MLSNLSNNNSGNPTKNVVEKKHYEDIEKRLDEMQDEIEMTEQGVSTNSQAIASLDGRVDAVENNSTFPTLNTDVINPATGDKIDVSSDLDVDGNITADTANFGELSVNGTNFTTVKDDAAQAKTTAETAKNKADEAYDLADAVADELADYKADNEASITTGTLNADSVTTDSIAAQTINTNDFETTNAEIDKLYVDTIKATGFLELPTAGQSYYTIVIPAKTTASFSGIYTSDNNTDYPYYFTVSDGAVIYKQGSTEIIKDISFDRETGYTKVRVKSSTNITYISSALDNNPVTIEDGGDAYADYAFIPQKTGGYLIRGYDDTTTEIYIAGVLRAYAMSVEEEIIERTSVDFLKVNASIELPKEWDAGGTISYSTGEENEYISAQKKAGVTKPTWTSPIHSTIGSLSYSSKLVDEATVASYKGISETRQTQTISITNEASLQQLTAFHWTKNGTYWQPYELTRITIGDNTMWIDPTEANQGIRFYDNQVIADGTWNDVPVEEANAVPVNLVIFDAPTELSFPITNLGDKTTVHGEITATCFKGNVLGNVTGNADTATNATCFDSKTYAEAKTDILSGCAADSNMFNGKTYSEAKTDILSGNAASATNATCFDSKTYSEAKADILSGCASSADNATCFDGKTYAEAKTDILSGTAAQANCVDIDSLTTNSYPLVMESTTCELGKSGTCPITFTPSTGILETTQVTTSCIENSGTTKSQCLCATCDLNVDGDAYITGDLTVQGTITTTHSEEVVTPSENIILRDGATTPIASGCYSGFTVTNYDGQDNNLEVGADKDGTLHVGVVGGTMEPIATRATEACMENGYAVHWDSTGTDLVTKGATSTHDLTVNGNASITGTLTADLTGTADNATKFDSKTYAEACADILSGCASNADNATKFDGKTYSEAKADILSGCAADSAKLGNKLPSCYIDTSSTAQKKAGNLSIGAPAACTTTSAGGQGVSLSSAGVIELYRDSCPFIDFHYQKYCGDYSSRIANMYATNTCNGILRMAINNGKGCTASDTATNYDFYSDGTFTGASRICASTNIYSAGCPVVTTGTLPTVAPGYNCTGTSNYVVTTMVCCACHAKTIDRNACSDSHAWHIPLTWSNTTDTCTTFAVSCGCPLTYVPATGEIKTTCAVLSNMSITNIYGVYCANASASTCYPIQLIARCFDANKCPTNYSFGFHPNGCMTADTVYSTAFQNAPVTLCYTPANTSPVWINVGWINPRNYENTSQSLELHVGGAGIVDAATIDIHLSSATGPTWTIRHPTRYAGTETAGLSCLCLTRTGPAWNCTVTLWARVNPYAANTPFTVNLYKKNVSNWTNGMSVATGEPSGDGLLSSALQDNMNIFAGTVRGDSIVSGNPLACTSTQTGTAGSIIGSGAVELYGITPFVDFRTNNACADYSHRIIANNGYLRLTSTNATGCTPATQSANFDFYSNGTLSAYNLKLDNPSSVSQGVYLKVGTASANANRNILFTPAVPGSDDTSIGEIEASTSRPLTYNPSTGVLTTTCFCGTAANSTCFGGCTYAQAKADIAGSVETTPFTCINDVNSGAQNILMTSSTGTLGIVNASTGTNACPLTFNPATGELATTCVKVGKALIKNESTGNFFPVMDLNCCYFKVCVNRDSDELPGENLLDIRDASVSIGQKSSAGSASITLGSISCAYGENSIVIGRTSNASSCMIVMGNSLRLCTGDEQSNCINAVVMSPHIDNCWACPSHIFGCARIMFKYGTKQCTMYKFLNCLFSGRDFTNCAYAYASRIVNGNCGGCIVGWDGLSYYAIRRNAAYSFCMDNHWSACVSCEEVIPTCCTNGYASFDLVW